MTPTRKDKPVVHILKRRAESELGTARQFRDLEPTNIEAIKWHVKQARSIWHDAMWYARRSRNNV